jgi:hypothetical protein
MYISLPELNEIFKHVNGDLNWLGKLKFLWHKNTGTVKTMTGIVFGVAKEFQGKGHEGRMIVHGEKLHRGQETLSRDTVLTWVGDFNPRMVKVCENLGAENYRTWPPTVASSTAASPSSGIRSSRKVGRRSSFVVRDGSLLLAIFGKRSPLPSRSVEDPVAQLVEHDTFNVGVLGSSPSGITKKGLGTLAGAFVN